MADALAKALDRAGARRTSGTAELPRVIRNDAALPPLRDGQIHLGDTAGGPVGLDLSKLIEGRLLIQGNSGAGKSMLLRRIFEQSFGRVQLLVIDPDGEFSTLAEQFDVGVLQAENVRRVGGRVFAHHLREHRYSAVLDLSDSTSENRLALVADIAEGLIDTPPLHWHPLVVLVDEAQTLAPHYDTGDVEAVTRKRSIAALADLMGRGRKRGLAPIIATQRLAETSKAVCAKATNTIIGRTVFDRDLERAGSLLGMTAGASRPLRTLNDGEFMCLGPALTGSRRIRFKAGQVASRHKGASPKVVAPPKITAADAAALLLSVPSAEAPIAPTEPERLTKTGRPSRARHWLPQEDAIIRAGYANGDSIVTICNALIASGYRSVSTSGLSTRATALGLSSPKRAADWSDREDEILRDAYLREVRIIDICGLLAKEGFTRGRVSIQMRAIALGITRDRVNYWTEAEKKIAIEGLESGIPYREIIANLKAAGFERGMTGILKFAQKNNYSRAGESWTLEQTEQLKSLYGTMPVKELSAVMNKPIGSIRTRASNLNLKMRTPWTEAERKVLTDAEESGKVTITEAATTIGRPFPNVYAEARRMGLDMKKFGRNKK